MPLNKKEETAEIPLKSIFLVIAVIVLIIVGAFAIGVSGKSGGSLISPVIAVIPLKGEINSGMSEDFIKILNKVDGDITVSAIIIEVDSPGGAVLPSREIAYAVKNTKKPTVAWIREVGASGAYWIASASDKIIADSTSITGSIGVIGSYLQFSELMEKYGITYERLVSGQYKDTGSEFKGLTADERAYLQSKIDFIQDIFISEISENRNMPKTTVAKLATGEIFFGTEAKELGLIDVLGNKETAQKEAEQLAGIKSSRLVELGQKKSILDLLSADMAKLAYWVGKGIGDSWNPLADANDKFTLVAELQ